MSPRMSLALSTVIYTCIRYTSVVLQNSWLYGSCAKNRAFFYIIFCRLQLFGDFCLDLWSRTIWSWTIGPCGPTPGPFLIWKNFLRQICSRTMHIWNAHCALLQESVCYMLLESGDSGVARGKGGRFPLWQRKIVKNREKERENREKERKNKGKSRKRGKIGKKRPKSRRFFHFASPDK